MYFEKIIKALTEFDAVEIATVAAFEETLEKLQEDYGNTGRVYESEYAKAKALYHETVLEAKQKYGIIVEEELEKIHGIVREFVTAPVPSDFITTLEAIKAAKNNLSRAEAEAYLEKYKENYTARLGLVTTISEATGEKLYFTRYDAIKNDIDECGIMAMKFFTHYEHGSTMRALLLSESTSPFVALDRALERFMKEDVSGYADPQQTEIEEEVAEGLAELNRQAIEKNRMRG